MDALFLTMLAAFGLGTLAAALGGGRTPARIVAYAAAAAGAAAALLLGGAVLVYGVRFQLSLPGLLALGGGLALRLDALGAFFLVVIGFTTAAASIYGAGYASGAAHGGSRLTGAMFNVFALAMCLVVMADNVLTFLLMWEGMSLASYFLVMAHPEEEGVREAGQWYLVMAHLGFSLILASLVLIGGAAGSGRFDELRAAASALRPFTRNLVFVAALIGFGSKAGIVPLHVWLPKAHPAAPSHVSALMSGVMIKLGIYGLLRVALDLLGGGPAWWGALVLLLGAASALLGILYALMERDLKRLLAYSSVENVGIILIGLGAGLLFQSYGLALAAAVGFVGGLYHVANHAVFKSLLFLGAGAVVRATGTRNLEEMGGLIKRMPATAGLFLAGSAAIAALPPLNGFVSEWLVFQSLLAGFSLPAPELAVALPFAVAVLALTSGLAAACFVKAFGITFLALPRSRAAEEAAEAPRSMRFGMLLLAISCLALGVAPIVVVPALGRALAAVGRLPDPGSQLIHGLFVGSASGLGTISPVLLAGGLIVLPALVLTAVLVGGVDRRLRISDSWGCGRIGQTPRMEYTATAFAEPLRRVFEELYRPTKELTIDYHPESKYFVQSMAYRVVIQPWFEKVFYDPVLRAVERISVAVRRLQSGSLHAYLVYVAVALVALLVAARWL